MVIVQKGQTLSEIVRDFLAESGISADLQEALDQVVRANNIENPDLIYPGQCIHFGVLVREHEEDLIYRIRLDYHPLGDMLGELLDRFAAVTKQRDRAIAELEKFRESPTPHVVQQAYDILQPDWKEED